MSLRPVGGRIQSFVRPAFSEHDHLIEQMGGRSDTVDELSYSNIQVPLQIAKPWGVETLIGMTRAIEVWELVIQSACSTSYHCHITKDTLLVIMQGEALLRTERREERLRAGDFRLLTKRAFHQTTSLGDISLVLYEIEAPPNKNDLVRIQDRYHRVGKPYLFGSRLADSHCVTRMVLSEPSKLLSYLDNQAAGCSPECDSPIVFTPHPGLTRSVYAVAGPVTNDRAKSRRVQETFISSRDSMNRGVGSATDEYNHAVRYLSGETNDAHAPEFRQLCSENNDVTDYGLLVLLSGELDLMDFRETCADHGPGSSLRRLRPGDIFIREARSTPKILDAKDALYLTFHF
jgi:mannose-6-phosphate isomerase-like protein (cupin superfamily)